MVSKDLLELLICPETQAPLREADEALLSGLNARIVAGELENRSGRRLDSPFSEGLVSEGGRWLYPVVDGIPVLLVDEAIDLGPLADEAGSGSTPEKS